MDARCAIQRVDLQSAVVRQRRLTGCADQCGRLESSVALERVGVLDHLWHAGRTRDELELRAEHLGDLGRLVRVGGRKDEPHELSAARAHEAHERDVLSAPPDVQTVARTRPRPGPP